MQQAVCATNSSFASLIIGYSLVVFNSFSGSEYWVSLLPLTSSRGSPFFHHDLDVEETLADVFHLELENVLMDSVPPENVFEGSGGFFI